MSTEEDVEFVEPKLRVDICPEKNGLTCFKPQGKIQNVDERLAVTFQGLHPCTDYHVSYSHFEFHWTLFSVNVDTFYNAIKNILISIKLSSKQQLSHPFKSKVKKLIANLCFL